MASSPLALLLALVMAVHIGGTMIQYNITVRCDRIPWEYGMVVLEYYERFNATKAVLATEVTYQHEVKKYPRTYGSSEGPVDVVEVHGTISHNCTKDGTGLIEDFPVKFFNLKNGQDYQYNLNWNLGARTMWY